MKDIYVKFSGSEVVGETRDKGSEAFTAGGAVEVDSWSHVIRQPKSATSSTAGGHTSERVEHGDMIFTKEIDTVSTKMYQACSSGTVFADVEIRFFRANSTGPNAVAAKRFMYLTIKLKNAIISLISPSVAGEGIPGETFQLKYSAVEWVYNELRPEGVIGKSNIKGAWNLARNTASFEGS